MALAARTPSQGLITSLLFVIFVGVTLVCDTVPIKEFISKGKQQDDCEGESKEIYDKIIVVCYSLGCTKANHEHLV
jgi:hypothetical protein